MDTYLLRVLVKPAVACLAITFLAMLLEQALRIIDELNQRGAHLGYIFGLITSVAPYHLGLALPLSFLIAMMMVVARLQDDGEIEAMLASGRSLTRIAAPFVLVGLVLSVVSFLLLGFLQPYSRYYSRAVRNAVINAGWTGELQPQIFLNPGAGVTITADDSDPTGRRLTGVFVRRLDDQGGETVATANRGVLALGPDNTTARLQLDQGLIFREDPNGSSQVFRFENVGGEEALALAGPLAPRGANERELTMGELVREMATAEQVLPGRVLKAELYGRIVRSLVFPILPLIAFALGLATKRGRRAPGLVLAGVLMIGLHHGVQMARGVAAAGDATPEFAIGAVAVIFCTFAFGMYAGSLKRPGDTPLSRLLERLQRLYDSIAKWRRRPQRVRKSKTSLKGYLSRVLLIRTAFAWGVLILVLQMIALLDLMEELLDRGGLLAVGRYMVLMLPEMAQETAGMAMLIGAVLTFMQLSRSSEMVVMRATGFSMFQIFKAAAPVGVAVVLLHGIVADQVTPRAQAAFNRWWEATAPNAGEADAEAQWFRIGEEIVQVGGASPRGDTLEKLRIYQRDARGLSRRLTAESATAQPGGGWRLRDAVVVNIEGDRAITTRSGEMFWQTPLRPDDAAQLFADVPQISSREAFGSLTGRVPATQTRSRLITRLHRSLAEPIGALAMLLLALPLALGHPRSDQTLRVLYAVIGGLLYLVVDGLLTAAGQAGGLPPALAAWAGPGIFVCLTVTVLLHMDK
jgi:lipopolysaccharide export system permease protein